MTAALIDSLAAAFGDADPPSADHLVKVAVYPGSEAAQVASALAGHRWRTLPFEAVDRVRDRVALLTDEAWRYYLPGFLGYLLADLPDLRRADVFVDALMGSLVRPAAADAGETLALAGAAGLPGALGGEAWDDIAASLGGAAFEERARTFDARVAGLGPAQVDAVRGVLEYLAREHGDAFVNDEPRRALERYWAISRTTGAG